MFNKRQILKALDRAHIEYKSSKHVLHLHCVFHKDVESPSLVIYFKDGHFHCYGCGAHGKWDALAEVLELGKLNKDWEDPLAFKHLEEEIESLVHVEPALPTNTHPWTFGGWRDLTGRTLSKVSSLWWWDDLEQVRRIVWPIWNHDSDLVGWVGRDIDNLKDSPLKYRNMPKMKVTSTLWPWPIDLIYPERTLVLVEGIVDALKLLQCGIPAMAILGTTWSNMRTSLITNLEVDEIVLAFDPDFAGAEATRNIGKQLSKRFTAGALSIWEWPHKKDPGDAADETLKELRKEISAKPRPHPWLKFMPKFQQSWFPTEDGWKYARFAS